MYSEIKIKMQLIKSHVIKLNPTKSQKIYFEKACGIKRHSFNWALAKWEEMRNNGEKPSATTLIKLQNSIKKELMPFYSEVTKNAPQYAIWDVEAAYKKYFKNLKKGEIEKGKNAYIRNRKKKALEVKEHKLQNFGKPNFKKKGKCVDSFTAVENNKSFKMIGKKMKIPILGYVKCTEELRFSGDVNNVTIKKIADYWYAVVNVKLNENPNEMPMASENQVVVGVDLGIKQLATLSNGVIFENPKPLSKSMKSLKRSQRSLSRKEKGSLNRTKQALRVARKHKKISDIRKFASHNLTSYLVNNFDVIVIEDLNVSGMLKNKKLSKAISDVSFYEIRRQLEYKSEWNNKTLIVADRFYASSKTCSNCGDKNDNLKLSERTFKCNSCNAVIDRDLNASINLANLGSTSEIEECKASGELSSAFVKKQRSSKKEELENNLLTIKF